MLPLHYYWAWDPLQSRASTRHSMATLPFQVRKEILHAMSTYDMNKTDVYRTQLLDSIIKGAKRLDEAVLAIMNR